MNQARFKVTFGSSVVLGTLTLALGLAGCSSDDNNNQSPATGTGGDTGAGGGNNGGSHSGGAGGKGGSANGGTAGKGGAETGGTAGNGGTGTGGAGTGGAGTGGAKDAGPDVDGCVPDAPTDPSNVPADVAVPSGTTLVYQVHATGTQNYKCTGTPVVGDAGVITYAWTFVGPVADLHDSCGVVVGKHFAGPSGPTAPRWESITDGSLVQGAKKKSVAVTGSIPALLLQATAHEGSTGVFSDVHFIQRLDTTGGAAPAAGDCNSSTLDHVEEVPYTANYYFYSGGPDAGI